MSTPHLDTDRAPDPDRAAPAAARPPDPGRAAPTPDRSAAVRYDLANERTLLAWQRTALALAGLGFVVDRFAFEGATDPVMAGTFLGLAMILIGALAAVVGVYRFIQVERQIDTDSYRPSLAVHVILSGLIVVAAVAMVVYLLAAKPA